MLKPVFENQRDVLSARTLVDSIRETVTVRIMNLSFHSNPGKLKKGELHPIESIHYPKNSTVEIPIQELGVPEYLEELLKMSCKNISDDELKNKQAILLNKHQDVLARHKKLVLKRVQL